MEKVAVQILFFAKARELVDKNFDTILLNKTTSGQAILEQVLEIYPVLQNISHSLVVAVNEAYVELEQLLEITSSSQIAIIPPLSGG